MHTERRRRKEFPAFMNEVVADYPSQEIHVSSTISAPTNQSMTSLASPSSQCAVPSVCHTVGPVGLDEAGAFSERATAFRPKPIGPRTTTGSFFITRLRESN